MGSKKHDERDVLGIAIVGARKQALKLHALERGLLATALVGLVVVALRSIAEVPTPALMKALLGALLVFVFLFAWASRARARLEHLIRDIQTLEIADESLAGAPSRVDVRPYRADDGKEYPLVVVRNDTAERALLKTGGESRGWRSAAYAATAVVVLAGAGSLAFGRTASSAYRWTFADRSEPAALGFRVSGERAGAWLVEEHPSATAAHALANRAGDEQSPPATLVADSIRARDVKAATRCKVASDRSSCGVVFRYRDHDNHHLARIDFAAHRVIVSVVTGGAEREIASVPARVDAGVWQELAVDARGDHLRITCNGREAIDTSDGASSPSGSVGLWVPAASEAYFDDLTVEAFTALGSYSS